MKAPAGCLSLDQAAKVLHSRGIDIGEGRLFKVLRERRILQEDNLPQQRFMGWFRVARGTFTRGSGKREMYCRTFLNERGLVRIQRLLTAGQYDCQRSIEDDETSAEIAARTGMAWDDSLDRMPVWRLGV
jgi:hypothetical protein